MVTSALLFDSAVFITNICIRMMSFHCKLEIGLFNCPAFIELLLQSSTEISAGRYQLEGEDHSC